MADQRITQLVELSKAAVAENDALPVADISASETKKITVKNLVAAGIDLVDAGEIDIAKLDQSSATKLDSIAIADNAITAAKFANDSSVVSQSAEPTTDNFDGRGWFNRGDGNLKIYSTSDGGFSQVVMPTAGIGDLQVTTAKLAAGAVTTEKVTPLGSDAYAAGSVTTDKIANLAVTAEKIAVDTITASQVAPNAIGASELADDAVDTLSIQDLAVTTAKIADEAVSTGKLADLSVTNDKIVEATIAASKLNLADGSIAGAKITSDSITSLQVAAGAIGEVQLANLSVSTAKLQDESVTAAKIAADSITAFQVAPGAIGQSELADNSVDSLSIINLAVTEAKLADGAVATAKLADLSVANSKIANNTISYQKLNLEDASIPGAKIQAESITASHLAPGSVGTSELQDLSVTAAKLATSAVTTDKIADLSITAGKIALGAIEASQIASGTITYSKIQNVSDSDKLLGRFSAGAGTIEEIDCTEAGRLLIAGATAADQRSTLGLGTLSTASGTWVDGSSFSGTSSGINTGDQTITLTGAVTGSGTGTFATTLAVSAVTETSIATGAVTSAKIAVGAVTQDRLSDNSAAIVNTSAPVAPGSFIGQHWINTSTAIDYVWTGTAWLQQAGINAIGISESTPITLNVSYPDPYTAILTATLDTQGAATVWAGPVSGDNAEPTFRALVGTDLPLATNSVVGAIKPGSGLTIPEDNTGALNHSNSVTAATVSGITFDAQGHISAAVPLAQSDIPELDASKIGTGSISVDRIADGSITSAKLADYATAQLGETLPVPNFIGEIFLNPLDKTFFMWDGNVWVPIGISAGQVIFAGTYDASTNTVASVTGDGAAIGLGVGLALPLAGASNSSYYVVVSEGGTGTAPAPEVTLAPPDILLSNGTNWVEVDVSSTYVAQSANNVSFTPAASLGSTDVQAALEEVSTECRNAANITSGTLPVVRGGTGLTTYAKGDLVVGNASNALTALTVGTNGQVLCADSAEALGVKWITPTAYVSSVASTTAALTVTNPTTTPSLAIRTATTAVNGIVQLSDSVSTTSSTLAATATAVKVAYDLANAALPKAGGILTGDLQFAQNIGILYEGNTIDAFQSRIYVAEPTADHTILFPDMSGTLAMVSQLDDGTF